MLTPTDGTVAREVRVLATTVQERIGAQGLIPGLPVSVEFVLTGRRDSGRDQDRRRNRGDTLSKAPKSKQKAWEGRWDRFLEAEHRWTWKGYWSPVLALPSREGIGQGLGSALDRLLAPGGHRDLARGRPRTWSRRGHRTSKKHDSLEAGRCEEPRVQRESQGQREPPESLEPRAP
ncbi:MAG: hypothetical protein R2878_13210 [Thermoleophilia bacterium]